MGLRMGWLTVDCSEPARLAEFWTAALGYEIVESSDEEVAIQAPDHSGWPIVFYVTEGAKQVKNRLHLDLIPDDQAVEVERLVGLGAREVDIGQRDVTWVVMADPEGNEFCILTPRPRV